jgi:cysteine desulfurase/selenocysteine lyase
MDRVWQHEHEIVSYALERLHEIPNVTIFGPQDADHRSGVVSFAVGDVHPHDVAAILDEGNVAVRAGHHCTQPLMRALDVVATTRASFYLYNDREDVDRLIAGVHRVNAVFGSETPAVTPLPVHDGPCRKTWDERTFTEDAS